MPYKNTEEAKAAQRRRYNKYKQTSYFKHKALRAKARASYLKVPYNLDGEYLESIWTGECPVFGVTLNKFTDRVDESAAELDRFEPRKGYIKGNVSFISRRANRLKNNVTCEELEKLIIWMKKFGSHVS